MKTNQRFNEDLHGLFMSGALSSDSSRCISALSQASLEGKRTDMNSSEELFVQQFAKLFAHYRDALTLDTGKETGGELRELNETPIVEFDRMVSAARLALLEIEQNARE